MSKLTLTVDPEVVKAAKVYAASQQQSLSKMIENYLKSLPSPTDKNSQKLQGIVAELAGTITEEELADINTYTDYLQEKYQ